MVARCGPQLRSPSGGNLLAATKARASASVLIIGEMIPSAPKSSARLAVAKSPSGMRTTGAPPPCRMAAIACTVSVMPHRPCCMSTVTARKPSRAITSVSSGAASPHHPEKTVSPARSHEASEKDVVMLLAPRLTARLDLPDRLRRKLVDDATNLVIGEFYSLGIEIGAQLVEHVVVAGGFKARRHECLGVGLRVRARERKLPGRPQADKLVAASRRLELELLVVHELSLETFLALVETGHRVPRASRRAGRRRAGAVTSGLA